MSAVRKRATIAGVGAVGATALVGGLLGLASLFGHSDSVQTAQVNADCMRMLREFTDYPVLYPGEVVFGLPLTMCDRYRNSAMYDATGKMVRPATDLLALVYGTCQPAPDAGCPPPVQVIIEPPCGPGLHDSQKVEAMRIRGVDAFVKPDGSVRIESDQFTVSLFAVIEPGGGPRKQRENALRLAELLRGGNAMAQRIRPDTGLDVPLDYRPSCD